MEATSILYPQRLKAENKEIRLLIIHSGLPEEPIRCSLRTVGLYDGPTYTALSYVWGDATITKPILVNGVSFDATVNLESALRHIRKSNSDRVFWVDAVCIHQADSVERNAQVSLMGAVYSKASNMLIWLGESDLASDMIAKNISENSIPPPPSPNSHGFAELVEKYTQEIRKLLLLMHAIAKRPWFKRVWVIQECLLPRIDPIFQCGTAFIPWGRFYEAFWAVFEISIHHLALPSQVDSSYEELQRRLGLNESDMSGHANDLLAVNSIGVMRDRSNRGDFPSPLCAAILPSLGRLATVPHDYIHGFLGLVRDEDKKDLVVDYQRSHWDLYREVMDFTICRGDADDLHFLSMLSFKSQSDQHPSWVVDFSAQTNITEYTGTHLASQDSWRPIWEVWTSDDGDIFMLEGVYLDVVARAHAIPGNTHWKGALKEGLMAINSLAKSEVIAQAQSVKETFQLPPRKVCEASQTSSLHRLFLANSDPERFRNDVEQTIDRSRFSPNVGEKHWEFWWNVLLDPTHERHKVITEPEGQIPQAELDGLSIVAFVTNILVSAWLACGGRTLVVTRGGLLAISVPDIQEGDVLVYLFGMHAPWILRPCPNNAFYTIVGSAFIHGLMDWSVLDECYNEGLLSVAKFCIR